MLQNNKESEISKDKSHGKSKLIDALSSSDTSAKAEEHNTNRTQDI
ncbi:MAG: hypothetical protein QG577_2287 [Thermodesulfobacteriota bacterium]|nr:hypothetical protein [Thermodesulfobacteriota bacterium]